MLIIECLFALHGISMEMANAIVIMGKLCLFEDLMACTSDVCIPLACSEALPLQSPVANAITSLPAQNTGNRFFHRRPVVASRWHRRRMHLGD